ncbi:Serine dehydratase-like [Schistosoma japonicum]|nr:Serine dehydratase-like [Schistosoma japonicum]
MHVNGCIGSNLSDVFPSLPFQDSNNNSSTGPILNINGPNTNSIDTVSRLKFLGLSLANNNQNGNGNTLFNEDRSRTNLIINYLPQSYDQNDLQHLFERVGPIRQCKLIRDKNTGASLCYGFVDFVNPQHAALAIQTYHGYETEQKRLRVAYASSGGRRFAPGHRLQTFSSGNTFSNSTNSEVTNENIIGWEIIVTGIPVEWTEPDLLRLFSNFGAVVVIRLLAPQVPDSPPGQKPRLSPALNGASSDISSESADNKFTSSASVIFQERNSAEVSVLRLNGYQAPEWASPLRLRLIGSVTRETYGLFYFSSRQSPPFAFNRTTNNHSTTDPLAESDILTNVLNRRALNTSTCAVHGNSQNHYMTEVKGSEIGLNVTVDSHNSLQLQPNTSFGIPPRAIIRNKVSDPNSTSLFNRDVLSQTGSLDILDFLDGHHSANSPSLVGGVDRCSSRDVSIINSLTSQRAADNDQPKLEHTLRSLANSQNHSPWPFTSQRTVLSSLPETGRSGEINQNALTIGVCRRLSVKSPLIPSPILSSLLNQRGCQMNVWLKLENIQPTGSFKIRGVENVVRKWAAAGVSHIVCPTTGNAGVAASFAAHAFRINCTLVVPETFELSVRRRLALEAQEAKIVVGGTNFLEAHHRAEQLVSDLQSAHSDSIVRLLHPYDQPELWEGYETIIDEITPEVGQPDAIIVAVGGGGLLSGVIQGLWNRGWSSTHIITVETEGADCLNRSLKSGQLAIIPRSSTVATSLSAPVLAQRAWNLAQCHSISAVTCTDAEAVDGVKRFLDDHGMLVDPACGAALSTVYSGYLSRLQLEGRLPRPSNILLIVGGGRNVSLRQLIDWENQMSPFAPEQIAASVLPPLSSSYITHLSPRPTCQEMPKSATITHYTTTADHEESRNGTPTPGTPRSVCTILSRTAVSRSDPTENQISICNNVEVENSSECAGSLNPHDLVNFSKLLASSEAEGEDGGLRE